MSNYFSRTFRVPWSTINASGQIHLSEYFRYVIETAWDWGATIGLSITETEELGYAWVIRETEINLYRPLHANDIFELTIWLADWRRVHGIRCFEITLKDGGDIIAQGVQEIVALDRQTLRPVAIPEHIIERAKIENPRIIQHRKFPKFPTQPEFAFVIQRAVEWQDVDSLEHVNNAHFVSITEEAITKALAAVGWSPTHFKTQGLAVLIRHVQIQYLYPAKWGEILNIRSSLVELKPTGGVWYVEIERLSNQEPVVQCIIEWSLANRSSEEEQFLPESLLSVLKKKVAIA